MKRFIDMVELGKLFVCTSVKLRVGESESYIDSVSMHAAASAAADALSSDLFNNQIITSCRRGGQTIQFQSNSSQISKSYFDSDIFID